MKINMPDGTSVILVPHGEGVVIATQGACLPGGDRPAPSGVIVDGDEASMLCVLLEAVEAAEVQSVLGPDIANAHMLGD